MHDLRSWMHGDANVRYGSGVTYLDDPFKKNSNSLEGVRGYKSGGTPIRYLIIVCNALFKISKAISYLI
jgi:hypothetical protein